MKLTLSILLLNCSRHAGDLGPNVVASSKILVAMATKMVSTWRVVDGGWMLVGWIIHVCISHQSDLGFYQGPIKLRLVYMDRFYE